MKIGKTILMDAYRDSWCKRVKTRTNRGKTNSCYKLFTFFWFWSPVRIYSYTFANVMIVLNFKCEW